MQPSTAGVPSHLATPSFVALVAAWDQLARRLPAHAASDEAAALILNALKLSFAHSAELPLRSSMHGAPRGASSLRSAAARALALASQLADLTSQVSAECPPTPLSV